MCLERLPHLQVGAILALCAMGMSVVYILTLLDIQGGQRLLCFLASVSVTDLILLSRMSYLQIQQGQGQGYRILERRS